jgi:hypothetical protein
MTMSIRIATVLAAAAIALASPVLTAAANGSRNIESTTRLAQFCIPQDDIPDAPPFYC